MRFLVLGPLEVEDGGHALSLGPVRRRLLARLLVAEGAVVPVAALASDVWGEPWQPSGTLRSQVRELRATIGKQRVSFTGTGYRLVLEDDELDSKWFRSLSEEGLRLSSDGLHAKAMGRLQAALSWWRGPALPELADVKWARPYLDRLTEEKLACTMALLRCQLALGRAEEAVALAKAELPASPGNEDLLALAMVALARCARQAEALDLYEKHLRSLGSRSLLPGSHLRAVERAVREQCPEVMSGPGPALGLTMAKVPSCPRALARLLQADFVGRAKELELFSTALAKARSGGLVAMVVAGEAGAGKTALLARMAEQASRTGATVLHGAAPQAASASLLPIAQAMEDFLARQGRDGHVGRLGQYPWQLVRLAPRLAGLVQGPALAPPASPELDRWQLVQALSSWLSSAGAGAPTVALLDDLHWADADTLAILGQLVIHAPPERALLVLAYRTSEAAPALLGLLGRLGQLAGTGVTTLTLSGLSLPEVSALVALSAPQEQASTALAEELWRRTDGNPFFVVELLRALPGNAGEAGSLGLGLAELPDDVVNAVEARVATLGRQARTTLCAAALIGTEFSTKVLAGALEQDDGRVVGALEDARRAGLVRELDLDRWCFSHDIVREALQSATGISARSRVHLAIARTLETVAPGEHAALAHHFSLAPESEAIAAAHSAAAAEQAMARLAYEEAASWYARAVELYRSAGEEASKRTCELLVRQGEAAKAAGSASHREVLLEASRLAKTLGEPGLMARAALSNGRGGWSFAGLVDTERIAALEDAIATQVPGDDPSPRHAELLSALAGELVFTPERDRRHRLAREALTEARRAGDDASLVDVACAATIAMWEAPLVAEFSAIAEEALAPALRLGDPERLFQVQRRRYLSALDRGETATAAGLVAEMARIAADLGQPALRWYAMMFEATLEMLHGRLGEAEGLIEGARRLGATGPGAVDGQVWYLVELMLLRYEQGRLAELASALAALAKGFPLLPTVRAGLALAHLEAGDTSGAARIFDASAAKGFDEHPSIDCTWICYTACFAEVAYRLRRPEQARRLYAVLRPYGHLAVACGIVCYGSAQHYLGLLASTFGEAELASEHLSAALNLHLKWGAPFWVQRSREGLAHLSLPFS